MIEQPHPEVRASEALVFDETTHTYSIGGRRIPSVTQVIGSIMPGWQADEWYMRRGQAMHHGCRLLDEGRLDWSTVAPEIEGRLRAWGKFRAECPSETIAMERPLAHPQYGFAGTLDRILRINGDAAVVDLKSTVEPMVKPQLGAYSLLWEECQRWPSRIKIGIAVELHDDGTYRTLWLNEKELALAGRTFLACLTLHGFMQREGIKQRKEPG